MKKLIPLVLIGLSLSSCVAYEERWNDDSYWNYSYPYQGTSYIYRENYYPVEVIHTRSGSRNPYYYRHYNNRPDYHDRRYGDRDYHNDDGRRYDDGGHRNRGRDRSGRRDDEQYEGSHSSQPYPQQTPHYSSIRGAVDSVVREAKKNQR